MIWWLVALVVHAAVILVVSAEFGPVAGLLTIVMFWCGVVWGHETATRVRVVDREGRG